MWNGNTGGSGGSHTLPNIDFKLQRKAMEDVSSARNCINVCTIPESAKAYLVQAKTTPHTWTARAQTPG